MPFRRCSCVGSVSSATLKCAPSKKGGKPPQVCPHPPGPHHSRLSDHSRPQTLQTKTLKGNFVVCNMQGTLAGQYSKICAQFANKNGVGNPQLTNPFFSGPPSFSSPSSHPPFLRPPHALPLAAMSGCPSVTPSSRQEMYGGELMGGVTVSDTCEVVICVMPGISITPNAAGIPQVMSPPPPGTSIVLYSRLGEARMTMCRPLNRETGET